MDGVSKEQAEYLVSGRSYWAYPDYLEKYIFSLNEYMAEGTYWQACGVPVMRYEGVLGAFFRSACYKRWDDVRFLDFMHSRA